MINQIKSINSFSGRSRIVNDIADVRKAFDKTFPNLRSPSRCNIFYSEQEKFEHAADIKDISDRLKFVRSYVKTLHRDGGITEHFRGFFGIIKAFRVANCDEYAEILKTILRLNGVKKVDIFELYAIDEFKRHKPRQLDHMITAIGVSKGKNQKQKGRIFIPSNNTKIIDFWLDNKVRKYKDAKDVYKIFGLEDSEKLAFKAVKSYEPTQEAFEAIIKEFPALKIKRPNKKGLFK